MEKYMTEKEIEQLETEADRSSQSESGRLEEIPVEESAIIEPGQEDIEESNTEEVLVEDEEFDDVADEEQDDGEVMEQQSDLREPEEEPTVESVIEAVLFVSDEPLTDGRLAKIVDGTPKQIRQYIDNLNEKYRANNNAFRIEQIAGGYQMLTLSRYNLWLKKLVRERSESKLSPAALETLAIIAYKQPVIRADIEAIRGVAAGEVLRSLCYKGLVKIVGRAEVLGRPMLYGTTKKFLEVFGLNTLRDLPKIEELKKPES